MSVLAGRVASAMLRGYSRVAPTERGSYRLIRIGRRLIPRRQWRSAFRTPDAISLDLDLATYPDCAMAFGLYELDTYRALRRLIQPGAWFVDCGANIGYFSLLAAKWVGPRGRVDAFEPDPLNRARLEANLARNSDPGAPVTIHPVALSDRDGSMEIFHPVGAEANHGMSGAFARDVSGGAEKFVVPTARLDEKLGDVPNLIKIDVEGGELLAIKGASKLLAAPLPPTIVVEHNPATAAAAHFSPGDLFRNIVAIQPQYQFFWIGRRLMSIDTPETLDAIQRQGNLLVTCARDL